MPLPINIVQIDIDIIIKLNGVSQIVGTDKIQTTRQTPQ
jgi:hypothetical protein